MEGRMDKRGFRNKLQSLGANEEQIESSMALAERF
jgi:hypothetical protein